MTQTETETDAKPSTARQTEIQTEGAPAPVGPYSQAIALGGLVFVSGQIPLDPATAELDHGALADAPRQVLRNLQAILEAAGSSLASVVKATVYLTDFADFPTINRLYGEALGGHRPARSTVQVAALPKGASLEIDLVAKLPSA